MTTIQESTKSTAVQQSVSCSGAEKWDCRTASSASCTRWQSMQPGYLQSALREATGMGRSTVNSALKKLEREGILTLSPGSGRHTCVSLTAQGHRLADRTVCRLIRLEDRIYASWTPEEQALLLRLNRDFTEKLEAIVASL